MTDTTGRPSLAEQPMMRLPAGRLLVAVIVLCVLGGGGFALAGLLTGRPALVTAGLAGGGIVAGCTTFGLLVIAPWIERPAVMCVTMWLAQTVVRLLLTPVVTYLLYSATPLGGFEPLLAVGTIYAATVIGEAMVFARYLQRTRPAWPSA